MQIILVDHRSDSDLRTSSGDRIVMITEADLVEVVTVGVAQGNTIEAAVRDKVGGIREGNTVKEEVVEHAVSLAVHLTVGHAAAQRGAVRAVTRAVRQETIETAAVAAATRGNDLASGRYSQLDSDYL
jgi:hypothetical protein